MVFKRLVQDDDDDDDGPNHAQGIARASRNMLTRKGTQGVPRLDKPERNKHKQNANFMFSLDYSAENLMFTKHNCRHLAWKYGNVQAKFAGFQIEFKRRFAQFFWFFGLFGQGKQDSWTPKVRFLACLNLFSLIIRMNVARAQREQSEHTQN